VQTTNKHMYIYMCFIAWYVYFVCFRVKFLQEADRWLKWVSRVVAKMGRGVLEKLLAKSIPSFYVFSNVLYFTWVNPL
jgi:hypothetical protein